MVVKRGALRRLRDAFRSAPAASALAAACLLAHLVQRVADGTEFAYGYTFGDALRMCFGLNGALLLKGFFWQPVTYLFLHGGWGHLLLNLFALLLFGMALEAALGGRRTVRIFLVGGIVGGLGWLAFLPLARMLPDTTAWIAPEAKALAMRAFGLRIGAPAADFSSAACVGASGGVFALMGAYAAVFPRRIVYGVLLLIPFKMRARTLMICLAVLTLADAVLIRSQVAYAAHLAGGLAGYLIGRKIVMSYE